MPRTFEYKKPPGSKSIFPECHKCKKTMQPGESIATVEKVFGKGTNDGQPFEVKAKTDAHYGCIEGEYVYDEKADVWRRP